MDDTQLIEYKRQQELQLRASALAYAMDINRLENGVLNPVDLILVDAKIVFTWLNGAPTNVTKQ